MDVDGGFLVMYVGHLQPRERPLSVNHEFMLNLPPLFTHCNLSSSQRRTAFQTPHRARARLRPLTDQWSPFCRFVRRWAVRGAACVVTMLVGLKSWPIRTDFNVPFQCSNVPTEKLTMEALYHLHFRMESCRTLLYHRKYRDNWSL